MDVYISMRGVDNGADPYENDGKIYELSLSDSGGPTLTPSRTPTSSFTPTPSNTFTPSPPPTVTNTVVPSSLSFYLSLANNGPSVVGNLSGINDEDILYFDGNSGQYSLIFDGSDVGVGGTDLDALYFVDSDTILMSFTSARTLPGVGTVDNFDIVQFDAASLGNNTAGTFSLFFDGSDVGFDTAGEDIDAIDILPDGRILISTAGNASVPGITTADEDILAFTPTSLGDVTAGTWAMYFDGSDVGLADNSGEDIDGLSVAANGDIYLTTRGDFVVPGVSGANEDLFVCRPISLGPNTACNYLPTIWDGSLYTLAADDLDGVHLVAIGPAITPTASLTPTFTAIPSATLTPTFTLTPSATSPVISPTPSQTPTLTNTPTFTSTPTITNTPTNTLTPTPTLPSSSTPTATATSTQPGTAFYVSLGSGGTVGGVVEEDIDILYFDGANWSMYFDASDVGISTSSQNLNAFARLNANTLLMSFSNPITLAGITYDPWDIIRFDATSLGNNTAGTFSLYFDGNDVGLDTTSEYIDALSILPDGRLLISTTGTPSVPGVSSAADEDILAFTPASLGDVTSGTWAMYFDGSDVGLADNSGEDVEGLAISANGDLYLSTLGDFVVSGMAGANEDVFICSPSSLGNTTACNFSPTLFFDGSVWGLDANDVDAIELP
jgi:hypothetical protein